MDTSAFTALHVGLEEGGRLVTLRFEHGKANEFGQAQLRDLEALVGAIRAAPEVGALLVYSERETASGTPVFVSGANVTERVGWTNADVLAHVRWQRGILMALRDLPVFVVMVADGLALGLGTELLLTADCRLATPRASFGLPETGLGIIPGALGTAELAPLVGTGNALWMGMTGETLDAETALRIGLLQKVLPDRAAALAEARRLVSRVLLRSPRAVAAFKAAVRAGVGEEAPARAEREARAYEVLVEAGEAAIGRESFKSIREGKTPPWSPREAG